MQPDTFRFYEPQTPRLNLSISLGLIPTWLVFLSLAVSRTNCSDAERRNCVARITCKSGVLGKHFKRLIVLKSQIMCSPSPSQSPRLRSRSPNLFFPVCSCLSFIHSYIHAFHSCIDSFACLRDPRVKCSDSSNALSSVFFDRLHSRLASPSCLVSLDCTLHIAHGER